MALRSGAAESRRAVSGQEASGLPAGSPAAAQDLEVTSISQGKMIGWHRSRMIKW